MKLTIPYIQAKIAAALPNGKVIARHNERGHFYEVIEIVDKNGDFKALTGPIYPSVTGKLQILKDESLINYKKNQVIQYFFQHFSRIVTEVVEGRRSKDEIILDELEKAERVPEDVLADASDIGTQIHDTRQRIFERWIKTGVRPAQFTDFIDPLQNDIRLKSAIRALQKFCEQYRYEPVATELFVYSHKLKVAGTLDDLGVMDFEVRKGSTEFDHLHEMMGDKCWLCDRKVKRFFVLMDLKSSNQFKPHYWFQVALYWEMIRKLIGVKPEKCLILKLSKEDGTFKIEELRYLGKLVDFAKAMLKTNDALDFIKEWRRDNQKTVADKIEL